ncbi:zinc-dependent alcohol dehydrogenase [Compostibacter hankyongensis]
MKAAIYKGNKTFCTGESRMIPPGRGEVSLKVAYCGICGTDVHIYHGEMDRRVNIPQVIGHEVSAEVIAAGEGVTGMHPGDKVVVRPLKPGPPVPSDKGYTHIGKHLRFMGIDTPGGMQHYWTVPADTLHHLPSGVSLQHGALIEPLAVACHDVRIGRVEAGEHAVVIGGGPIGMLIALVIRAKGGKVLLAEVNEHRLKLAAELGISGVNPMQRDLAAAVEDFSAGAMADVVFEVSGSAAGVKEMTRLPNIRGRIVMVAIHAAAREVDLFSFFWKEIEMRGARVYEPEDFEAALSLAADGLVPLPALISGVAGIDQVQEVFEQIDRHPEGMKYLIDCNS